MRSISLFIVSFVSLMGFVYAECPNACSAHGKCGAYDMCTCYRNWVANDCSQRLCQFGRAFVDSPKGDLDSSGGSLSGPDDIIVVNDQIFPYGTTELYPATMDTDDNVLTNTAHEYRECSNKGLCDRSTGTCACFEGYEGSACQRASCPSNAEGVCSGHGTCQTIKEIAYSDFQNIYDLWDEDQTMGCVCDGAYTGPDCSQRQCKVGVDPLYQDNNATVRYSNYTYQIYTRSAAAAVYGNYSLLFTDSFGETWRTEPIAWDANCLTIETTLEKLPNDVIPADSVRCYQFPTSGSYGQASGVDPFVDKYMYVVSKYTIAFPENPGRLPQIAIDIYLDGSRPTLYTDEAVESTLGWHIYPNGFIGEYIDLVPDRCFDVTVTLHAGAATEDSDAGDPYTHYLGGLTTAEAKLLKTCLGDSNGDASDNIEVYNWDYGDYLNPHLIKLQDATQYSPALVTQNDGETQYDPQTYIVPVTQLCANASINHERFGTGYCSNKNSPGFYAVVFFDDKYHFPFRLYTRAANDYGSTTEFYVYTTTGYLNLVNPSAVVFTHHSNFPTDLRVASDYSNLLGMAYSANSELNEPSLFDGDMSCETTPIGTYGARDCFNKGDWAMFLITRNTSTGLSHNPIYPNMYQIAKIWNHQKIAPNGTEYPDSQEEISRLQILLDYSMNTKFRFVNGSAQDSSAYAYKFHPPSNANGGYLYVSPCANRGICNTDTGTCECFNGYQDDDCTCFNALST